MNQAEPPSADATSQAMREHGWYTFGNHFHWVGMQWLWGTGILGRSVDDMLAFIEQTGSPGNINFDSNGYEHLASEDPAALAKLRTALEDGRVEVVGGTFGQPYGLFHHGESAVRQIAYGVRTSQRVLGVRPRSFWEEEFCFFPQLPQLLSASGYEFASLFFQWTWHTPELPMETVPAVRWIGVDGSELLTLPRSELNLHQWPEDVAALLDSGNLAVPAVPVVQQWFEFLPSPDWMCRSELVVPGVQNLFDNSGLTFRTGTLSTVLTDLAEIAEERHYTMDQTFHGMSIGKNGNRHHRLSRIAEHTLLAAETFSVVAGDLGRPYAHWNKYPAWELEEGWRELLAFQAHDNDECEGLNGHIGYLGLQRGVGLGRHVLDRTLTHLANTLVETGGEVVANPVGWERDSVVDGHLVTLPAFAVTALADLKGTPVTPTVSVCRDDAIVLERAGFAIEIDSATGVVSRISDRMLSEGIGGLEWVREGVHEQWPMIDLQVETDAVRVTRAVGNASAEAVFRIAPEVDALDVSITGTLASGPDGRYHSSLVTALVPQSPIAALRHDTPFAVGEIKARNSWSRKYPTGAWMTSPQEFETVHNVFTGLQFIDLLDIDGAGLLWIHDGAQAFHRVGEGVANVLSMRDPWDEDHYVSDLVYSARIIPHGPATDRWRWTRAQEFTRPVEHARAVLTITAAIEGQRGRVLAPLRVEQSGGSVVTAVFRDSDFAATGFPGHVNHLATQPVLIRVVELDGDADVVRLILPRTPLAAWRCTPLGEAIEPIQPEHEVINIELRAHEIATIAVSFAPAPGDERTLDGDRSTWATIHHDAPTDERS